MNREKSRKIRRAILETLGVYDGEYAYIGPRTVQIDLTNRCNNDCIGCWCNSPLLEDKKLPEYITNATLDRSLVLGLLNDLSGMGTEEIYFAGGGEPFMHPDAVEIFMEAKKYGFYVSINTNFTIPSFEDIDRLVDVGIDHFIVSVWAGTAEVYSAVHPNKDEEDFISLKEKLLYLNKKKGKKGNKPIIKIYDVLLNLNYFDFENMIKFAEETGSESVEFTLLDTIPGKTDKLLLSQSEVAELKEMAYKADKAWRVEGSPVFLANYDVFLRRLSNVGVSGGSYDKNVFDSFKCYAGWSFARIIGNGDVNACLKSHRIPVGNLYGGSFKKIWNGAREAEFRVKTLAFKKDDPYFRFIGNDPNATFGCYRSCDNLGHSGLVASNMERIPPFFRFFLFCIAKFLKFIRKRGVFAGAGQSHTLKRKG